MKSNKLDLSSTNLIYEFGKVSTISGLIPSLVCYHENTTLKYYICPMFTYDYGKINPIQDIDESIDLNLYHNHHLGSIRCK